MSAQVASNDKTMIRSPSNKPIYELGTVSFVVNSKDAELERALDLLFPGAKRMPEQIHEVNDAHDLRQLMNSVLAKHSACIWIDAACLQSPSGKKVLICGQSGAGKSTTAMALTLKYGWRVLAEDITLFDCASDEIVSFASPFSVKQGTIERLNSTYGIHPPELVLGEWVSLRNMHAEGVHRAAFDLSIYFQKPIGVSALNIEDMKATQFLRPLLRCSNLVHFPEAAEQIVEYVSAGRCCRITGGTLRDRVEFILESVQNGTPRTKEESRQTE